LRDYYSYFIVEISKLDDKWDRLAKIQEWRKIKGRMKLVEADFGSDEFTCHVPTEIYAKYLKPRIHLGVEAVDEALAISEERAMASTEQQSTGIKEVTKEALAQKRGKRHKKEKRERKPRPPELVGVKVLR